MAFKKLKPVKVNVRSVELVIAVCVVVISLASLFVAFYQGRVMQKTLEANVWPALQVTTGNYNAERDQVEITFEMSNGGMGPAEVKSAVILYRGTLYDLNNAGNLGRLIVDCCAPGDSPQAKLENWRALNQGHLRLTTEGVVRRIFAPSETITIVNFSVPKPETYFSEDFRDEARFQDALTLWNTLNEERWNMSFSACYCSVFDQCWQADLTQAERQRVRHCPSSEPR
ncbi:hypothetical protein [Woodsholea maritima]|uniref:hypothetical protein n=1 Tax=Woodsholea maritima TaxID=240237 RepID=UPI00036F67BF|nr:hypothetical protein [Woodsholea maritima]